jgi:hypothetical protein
MSCDDAAVETCSCLWSACVVGRLRHPLLANEVHTAIEFASRWMDEEEFGQPCGD